jgi:hypothetical protein
MTPFRIILDPYNAGSELTYEIASYSGSAGFLTSERQISRIKFEITGTSNDGQGFWLDNVLVAEAGGGTDNPPGINGDGGINLDDFEILSRHWLLPCTCPSWCEGADLDRSGTVDMDDLTNFVDDSLSQEP